jgi:DeoR family deoxyribose operon repressor
VILCGGEFHASNAIFKPLNLQDTLSNLCPDIAFYSAAGVNVRQGQPALTWKNYRSSTGR